MDRPYNRFQLPQLSSNNLTKFFGDLTRLDIKHKIDTLLIGNIKPSQRYISIRKVGRIASNANINQSILIVNNNYELVDGHHRWYALKQIHGNDFKVKVIILNGDIHELITRLKVIDTMENLKEEDTELQKIKDKHKEEIENLKKKHFSEIQRHKEREFKNKIQESPNIYSQILDIWKKNV